MSIFRAYDIRGIYPTELNDEIAYKIGRAFAHLLVTESNKDKLAVAVARDMRVSGEALTARVIDGIRDGGINVVYIGLAATPTFYFAVANFNYDGGLIVSASHNPKEYNGFKVVRQRAVSLSAETGIKEIEKLVFSSNLKPLSRRGEYQERHDILQAQVDHDLSFADAAKIKPFLAVADAANAMGALYLAALFEQLPCKLIAMNFELDGTFPAHQADPFKEENTAELQRRVVAEHADLGIATDGDGDRVFFIDEHGERIEPAIIRGILAQVFLKEYPGAKIAYDIRPGRITREMIEEAGGIPVITRVGHTYIKEKTIAEKAVFAGESSGHFFLNMPEGCYEVPMIATLKLLQEFSESGKTVSDYVRPLKRYAHSGEINTKVRSNDEVLTAIKERYRDGNIDLLDGVTIEYPEFWFNVRGSNTEPLIRLNLEAKTKALMEQKRDEVLTLIRSFEV